MRASGEQLLSRERASRQRRIGFESANKAADPIRRHCFRAQEGLRLNLQGSRSINDAGAAAVIEVVE
jgi:hypothetical protein